MRGDALGTRSASVPAGVLSVTARGRNPTRLNALKGGGWPRFRRAWVARRKHPPVQNVMRAGRWRDVKALKTACQATDPETVRKVMEVC